MKIMMIQTT